jgi:hypothetical protein
MKHFSSRSGKRTNAVPSFDLTTLPVSRLFARHSPRPVAFLAKQQKARKILRLRHWYRFVFLIPDYCILVSKMAIATESFSTLALFQLVEEFRQSRILAPARGLCAVSPWDWHEFWVISNAITTAAGVLLLLVSKFYKSVFIEVQQSGRLQRRWANPLESSQSNRRVKYQSWNNLPCRAPLVFLVWP